MMKKKLVALIAAVSVMAGSMTALAAPSSTAADVADTAVVPVASTTIGTSAMSGTEQKAMDYRSPAAIQAVAQSYGMTYEEVANNAVSSPAGIPAADVYAVSQGDKIQINGVASTQHVYLRKLTTKTPGYSQVKTDIPEGAKLINVFNAILPVKDGNTVTVNFYLPKITGSENLTVQQFSEGKWVTLTIKELRKNHVVLDLTKSGPVRFILK